MNIGDKIKSARKAKGLTQEELGKIVGVQKAAIGKYEKGIVVNIKRSTLQKLANALDIRPSELIFEGSPESTADFHAKILMDDDVMDMIKEYYSLGIREQEIVRNFIHSLALEA